MLKPTKGFYGKYQKKKVKPFTERIGDWICSKCKNLNFAFRKECNRCKVPKKDAIEIMENKEENENENKSQTNNLNKKLYKYKKNNMNQFNVKDNKHVNNKNDNSIEK